MYIYLNFKINKYDGSVLEIISLINQDMGYLKEIDSLKVNNVISIKIKNSDYRKN